MSDPKNNNVTDIAQARVPIIGQPITPHGWFPTVMITCNCEAKHPLMLVGFNTTVRCPHCGRGVTLFGVTQDVRTGQPPHFEIGLVAPEKTES